jgi:hypothetical protein
MPSCKQIVLDSHSQLKQQCKPFQNQRLGLSKGK